MSWYLLWGKTGSFWNLWVWDGSQWQENGHWAPFALKQLFGLRKTPKQNLMWQGPTQ